MSRPIMKELALEPCKENLDDVANFLDNAHEFKKVKTKYAKEGPLRIAIFFNGNIDFKTSLNNNLLFRSKPFEQIIIDIFSLLSFEILSE